MTSVIGNHLHRSLCDEHFVDAGFMYEQRLSWLEDPELNLCDLAELERRQEAHLDALVVAGPQGLVLCWQGIREGRAADLHVGTRIACRCGQTSVLDELLARLDAVADDERAAVEAAASLALTLEMPREWTLLLPRVLSHPRLGPVVAEVIGQRRIPLSDAVLHCAKDQGAAVDVRVIRALGEIGDDSARLHLRGLLGKIDEPQRWSEVALACVKLGDRDVAARLASSPELSAWAPLAQVHVFDIPSAWLHASFVRAPTPELLLAIGLRGDPASLTACARLLGDVDYEEDAARALAVITGAPLDVHADSAQWNDWLSQHTQGWNWGARYRLGRPWEFDSARSEVLEFRLPLEWRVALRDELLIRNGRGPCSPAASAKDQLAWLKQPETERECSR